MTRPLSAPAVPGTLGYLLVPMTLEYNMEDATAEVAAHVAKFGAEISGDPEVLSPDQLKLVKWAPGYEACPDQPGLKFVRWTIVKL